jgi:penicillin-binding protein 1A
MGQKLKKVEEFVGALWRVLRRPQAWIPLVAIAAAGTGFAIGSWRNLCATCPSVAQIHTWTPEETSKLIAHDGSLFAEIGTERRTAVAMADLPPHVPQAFIAIEDRRFYEHGGIDIRALSRAVMARLVPTSVVRSLLGINLRTGGASTITQQLARNMFLEEVGNQSAGIQGILRKLRELQVAFEIEDAYSKDQILEAYMNQIYLGPGSTYGVQAAAQYYFGKDAVELSPAEAALIAAVTNDATRYSPFRNPQNALARREQVLDQMAREDFITREEAEEWNAVPLPVRGERATAPEARYVVEWIRQQIADRFPGWVNTEGLRIETTLDIDMQRAAEIAMERGFLRIEARPGFSHPTYEEYMAGNPSQETNTPYVQGAMIVMEPGTGAVRALVGGRDFEHSKFDRARQALRQPGSSFKTFVYAAALESGIPPSRIIVDAPFEYDQGPGLPIWRPENFTDDFLGPMTLRDAFRSSVNTVAVRLAQEIEIQSVVLLAQRFGIATPIPPLLATSIGAADVIPLQMSEAYSTLAALGTRARPQVITRVLNSDGKLLWEPEQWRTQVFDPVVARQMITLMETVVDAGSGNRIRTVAGLESSSSIGIGPVNPSSPTAAARCRRSSSWR